jgi:hypothetical protein
MYAASSSLDDTNPPGGMDVDTGKGLNESAVAGGGRPGMKER